MSNVLTYDSLREFIVQALNRTDPRVEAQLDTFIMLGERVCSQILNIEGLKKFTNGVFLVGNPIIEKPARWLSTFSFGIYYKKEFQTTFKNWKRLKCRTWTYIQEYGPTLYDPGSGGGPTTLSIGIPSQYSDMEYNQLVVAPAPDQAYPYVFAYYETPQLLSANSTTNFMTAYNPQVLMYASVMEANYFLQDYAAGDKWRERFLQSMQFVQNLDSRLIADGAQRRDHTGGGA